ncbi:hypothetical protein IGI39_004417 [Enterococcus sp. AZ135]|uniref:hypothetical protein n=1 Tax=unclassified Enterococcus TaxID=2608891 RepID=UPI003F208737
MKKIVIGCSFMFFLLGITGCSTDSEKTSNMESSEKIEKSTAKSTNESTKQSSEKKNAEESTNQTAKSEQSTSNSETAVSEEKTDDADFKELLSGIEYNKDYLTEDEIIELKETYKETLTDEQYKKLVELLDK